MADPFHPKRWGELTYDDDGLQSDEFIDNYAATTAAYDEAHEAELPTKVVSKPGPSRKKGKKCKRTKITV